MNVGGLHHVMAVTAKASENVAFYTDAVGSSGTDMTFWPLPSCEFDPIVDSS